MAEEEDDRISLKFPIEFMVPGTPVSSQTKTGSSRDKWKALVLKSLENTVTQDRWATEIPLSLTIYDFPSDLPQGDVDNIVKYIQDVLVGPICLDDSQVHRVVAQRFLPQAIDDMDDVPELVGRALVYDPPFVYICIGNDPLGEAT